jgi:glycosyltransferase involved in cell wall biosynthesis
MKMLNIIKPSPMKILTVHNSYLQHGGEDAVADMESRLLRDHGHDVECYRQSNAGIHEMPAMALACASIWSHSSAAAIDRSCASFQPDLIHAHNTFPLISPALYWMAARRKIPIVLTLHNFRLLCPQAMFLREGKNCEACLSKLPWRAVTRKCYRNSLLQSGAVAIMLTAHRAIGTYRNKVTSYIAPSDYSRRKFIAGGFPQERIHVKPNFVDVADVPEWTRRKGGLFVGRLSPEKGLGVLIEAMEGMPGDSASDRPYRCIRVVGSGPMEERVARHFGDRYLGARPSAEVLDLLRTSLFLVAPSTCGESFGLVVIEAFSCGVAVIASNRGALAELVEDGVTGLLVVPGDASDLARKIQWACDHPDRMLSMGRAAYAEYRKKYTASENYGLLMGIYRNAMSSAALSTRGAENV